MTSQDGSEQAVRAPTVLLTEDDPRIASFVTKSLSALGFGVDWVTTGAEALARMERGGVDVHILDLGLPDIDGLDVLRVLQDRGAVVPVIVITARADPANRRAALGLGATRYLRKPFPLRELIASVRECAAPRTGPG